MKLSNALIIATLAAFFLIYLLDEVLVLSFGSGNLLGFRVLIYLAFSCLVIITAIVSSKEAIKSSKNAASYAKGVRRLYLFSLIVLVLHLIIRAAILFAEKTVPNFFPMHPLFMNPFLGFSIILYLGTMTNIVIWAVKR